VCQKLTKKGSGPSGIVKDIVMSRIKKIESKPKLKYLLIGLKHKFIVVK
jgi:hypothetical protein